MSLCNSSDLSLASSWTTQPFPSDNTALFSFSYWGENKRITFSNSLRSHQIASLKGEKCSDTLGVRPKKRLPPSLDTPACLWRFSPQCLGTEDSVEQLFALAKSLTL
jgi:hypothetical protein